MKSQRLPFYRPAGDEYVAFHESLYPVDHPDFQTQTMSLLSVPKNSHPQFIATGDPRCYHVLEAIDDQYAYTFCRARIQRTDSLRIVSGLTQEISVEVLCYGCVQAYTGILNGPAAPPLLNKRPRSKQEKALKLFLDVKTLGHIEMACELNHLNRRAYYRLRDQFPQLHAQILV